MPKIFIVFILLFAGLLVFVYLTTPANWGSQFAPSALIEPTRTPFPIINIPPGAPVIGFDSPKPAVALGVTLAGYQQLSTGMAYGKAVAILGANGEEISRSNLAGYETVMYQWKGGTLGANMNAMFQNGRLISKAQFGLK